MSLVLLLSACALAASVLTFFSGFGLGTILTPVFAIWFPIELAIALTAVVHLLNGLFKLVLVGKFADREVVLRFGLPAILASFLGAWLLSMSASLPELFRYALFGREWAVTPVKLGIAALIAAFTLFEVVPRLRDWGVDPRYVSLGGVLSGFFGGLSGHQGALRSAFLARLGLSKEGFVATGVWISCFVDLARLGVYLPRLSAEGAVSKNIPVLLAATLSAFAGAYFGSKLLKKVTMDFVRKIVSIGLFALALALAAGIV